MSRLARLEAVLRRTGIRRRLGAIARFPGSALRHAMLRHTGLALRPALARARAEYERTAAAEPEPLVTVTIATWNRAELLVNRSLASVLAQTYHRLEVIVVGDCCTDDTAARMAAIRDPRVRWINLPERGRYPRNVLRRHRVAGVVPQLHALGLATGAWIAHQDDDEEWLPEHVEVLLATARAAAAELVWGQTLYELSPGDWHLKGQGDLAVMDVPHSAQMMRAYLRMFAPSRNAWRFGMGADHHQLWRLYYAGVRYAFAPQVVTRGPLRPGTTVQWSRAEDRETFA